MLSVCVFGSPLVCVFSFFCSDAADIFPVSRPCTPAYHSNTTQVFCYDCEALLCPECRMTHPRGHTVRALDLATERRSEIDKVVESAEAATEELRPLLVKMTEAEGRVDAEYDRARGVLRSTFAALREELDRREATLEADLLRLSGPAQRRVTEQKMLYDDLVYKLGVRQTNIRKAVREEKDHVVLAKGRRWQELLEGVSVSFCLFFFFFVFVFFVVFVLASPPVRSLFSPSAWFFVVVDVCFPTLFSLWSFFFFWLEWCR